MPAISRSATLCATALVALSATSAALVALSATSALAGPLALQDESPVAEASEAPEPPTPAVATGASPSTATAPTASRRSTDVAPAVLRSDAGRADPDSTDPAELLTRQLRSAVESEATAPPRLPKAARAGEAAPRSPAVDPRDDLPVAWKQPLKDLKAWLQGSLPWVFGEPTEPDASSVAVGGPREPHLFGLGDTGVTGDIGAVRVDPRRTAAHEPGARAEASIEAVAAERASQADLWAPFRDAVAWVKALVGHPVTWLALFLAGLLAMSVRLMKRASVRALAKRPQAATDIPVRHRPSRSSRRSRSTRR